MERDPQLGPENTEIQEIMMNTMHLTEAEEMFLERLWCLREEGRNTRTAIIGNHETQTRENLLAQMESRGLLRVEEGQVFFSEQGERCGHDIIRRRRLTEVLLYSVLKLNMSTVESNACKIEHIIDEEVTESICNFLGHPSQCPHGHVIPQGTCCTLKTAGSGPLITPLNEVVVGGNARIVFTTSNQGNVLQRLTSMGIYPGAVVHIRQHQPTTILRVGETEVALDPKIVKEIFCRTLRA